MSLVYQIIFLRYIMSVSGSPIEILSIFMLSFFFSRYKLKCLRMGKVQTASNVGNAKLIYCLRTLTFIANTCGGLG